MIPLPPLAGLFLTIKPVIISSIELDFLHDK